MPSVGIAGGLSLACAYGVGGGIAACNCRLLEYLCRGGTVRPAFFGILGGGIDLVVSHLSAEGTLSLKVAWALKSCPSFLTVTCVLVVGTV